MRVALVVVLTIVVSGCGSGSRGGKLPPAPPFKDPFPAGQTQTPQTQTPKTPGKLTKVTITPMNQKMAKGDTIVFSAKGEDANGLSVPVLQPNWGVSPQAGFITPNGQFTAAANGIWTITCESQGVLGLVTVEVG